jgi:hypothetical protein
VLGVRVLETAALNVKVSVEEIPGENSFLGWRVVVSLQKTAGKLHVVCVKDRAKIRTVLTHRKVCTTQNGLRMLAKGA